MPIVVPKTPEVVTPPKNETTTLIVKPVEPTGPSEPLDPLYFIVGGSVLGVLVILCCILALCIKLQKPLKKPTKSPITKPVAQDSTTKHMAVSTQEDTSRLPIKLPDEEAAKVPAVAGKHAGDKSVLEI